MSDLGNADWSETDASNTATPPNGFPEGMFPSDVNNSARANMGGIKRFWDRTNSVKTTGGTTTAYTLTYDVAAASYYDGEEFSFVVNATCGSAPTLNINGLGAKNLRKFTAGAYANLAASDIVANQPIRVRYNLSATKFDVVSAAFIATDFLTAGGTNAFTGANDFTAGLIVVPTATTGDNDTSAASTAFVNAQIAASVAIAGGYFTSLKIQVTSDTAATITAGRVIVTDGTTEKAATSVNQSIATGTSGAGGLDTGSITTSTWYYLWLIMKADGTTSAIISASATAPTMPSGYTFKARMGAVRTDGSSHLYRTLQYGRNVQYVVGTLPATELAMSTANTSGSPAAVAVANFVPTTASRIRGRVNSPDSNGVYVAPNSTFSIPILIGTGTGGNGCAAFDFMIEGSNIYWQSNSGTAGVGIYVDGWEDNL